MVGHLSGAISLDLAFSGSAALLFPGLQIEASSPDPSDPSSGARMAGKLSAIIFGITGMLIALVAIVVSILKRI